MLGLPHFSVSSETRSGNYSLVSTLCLFMAILQLYFLNFYHFYTTYLPFTDFVNFLLVHFVLIRIFEIFDNCERRLIYS
ncbi:hypothetical protein Slin_6179 [Spirosoma linguale DSM 74]|uniref:Uncharacterized protein n=1 Tax=Spirosoma linguale (strain ATCC 33905 / DSM 74 / LMG 10896 / Claus 1) TaxID=504472 RepID=D2QTK6_SPILD|nr:hypothetical protein Slin_6179 [Spirosoma linguale DSM 74]